MDRIQGNRVTRREFLRATTCAAAAAGVGASVSDVSGAAPQTQPQTTRPRLPHGVLGKTGYPVTLVSFGAIKLRDRNQARVLRLALDKGVNLVHTSDSYGGGKSIQAVADVFKADPKYRDKVFLCLKGRTPQKEPQIDAMLKTLGTDHMEALLCELQQPDARRLEAVQALLDALCKKGKVRYRGFVCHEDMNGSIEMVLEKAPDYFEVAMPAMTMAPIPGDTGKGRTGAQSERFVRNLKALRARGVGILSMKSGAAEAVQKGPGVFAPHAKAMLLAGADSVLTSMDAFEQVDMIASLDLKSPHLTEKERQAAIDFSRSRSEACLMCGACTAACPAGMPVATLMRLRMYATRCGLGDQARAEFAELHVPAGACGDCSRCEAVCPVGLACAGTVRETAALLA